MVLRRARPPRREANHDGTLRRREEGGGRREEGEEEGGGGVGGAVLFSKQEPNHRRVGKKCLPSPPGRPPDSPPLSLQRPPRTREAPRLPATVPREAPRLQLIMSYLHIAVPGRLMCIICATLCAKARGLLWGPPVGPPVGLLWRPPMGPPLGASCQTYLKEKEKCKTNSKHM